jgi:prepilin signal peptidase PulO-like enzyme (type II secretory pathway)
MTERNTELAYLVAVSGLTAVGFAIVYIARRAEISWGSLGYAGFFIVLYLVAHLIARRTVPNADPYLLPMAGLLTAIGLTEIYRLGPDDAFKQGLWIVVGLALCAAALIALRRDYRLLESYKYIFGHGAIA